MWDCGPRLRHAVRVCFLFPGAAGALTTHIDDIFGCGESGVLFEVRIYSEECFGELNVQEKPAVH